MAIDLTDSGGQYISFGNLPAIAGLTTKTLLIWADFDTLPAATQTLFELYHVTSPNEIFFAVANFGTDSGKLGLGQRFTGNDGEWRSTNDVIAAGRNHLALTYDAGSSANVPVIYAAGTSVAVTTSTAPTGSAELGTASVLRIGAGQFVNRSIDGRILSLCWYNRILSAAEILDAYNSRLAIPTTRGLVFAPVLWGAAGNIKDGDTLATANEVTDMVSGARGVPSGSPVFRGDTYLKIR